MWNFRTVLDIYIVKYKDRYNILMMNNVYSSSKGDHVGAGQSIYYWNLLISIGPNITSHEN